MPAQKKYRRGNADNLKRMETDPVLAEFSALLSDRREGYKKRKCGQMERKGEGQRKQEGYAGWWWGGAGREGNGARAISYSVFLLFGKVEKFSPKQINNFAPKYGF